MAWIRTPMFSVFLDADVLIAASLSKRGTSYRLMMACIDRQLTIIVSEDVIEQSARNIALYNIDIVKHYKELLKALAESTELVIVDSPSKEAIDAAAQVIHKGDAPILAAAIKANPNYLITRNRRHFITAKVKTYCAFKVMTPDKFLLKILKIKNRRYQK